MRLAGGPAAPGGWRGRGLGAERGGGRRRAAAAWGALRSRGARLGRIPAPARARRALSGDAGHPAAGARALRRSGARLGCWTCPGQLRPRARGLHEARQGAGQGRRRGPAPPPRPAAGTAPRPRARRLCPPVVGRGRREDGRRPQQVCRGAPAAAAGEAPVRSRLSRRVALLLRVGPPRRGHADTLAHTGWHRHNPPAGVTGAVLPAAKTCPRYGACAKAFPSPGGVSRGGVGRSAGLGGGSWGWESLQPRARIDLGERQRRSEDKPKESVAGADLRPPDLQFLNLSGQKSGWPICRDNTCTLLGRPT